MKNKIIINSDCKQIIDKNQELDLTIEKNSKIEFKILKNIEVNIVNIIKKYKQLNVIFDIYVEDLAKVYFNNFDYLNINTNIEINVYLKAGAEFYINSMVISNNDKKIYNIKIINQKENSKGYIFQKAVAKNLGEVRLLATGEIDKKAKYSTNFQESRVLLLEGAKKGEASPFLYIDNNEVKAGHKAVVSKVDSESLYYLQTRGINSKKAQILLTHAFLNSVIDQMYIDEELKKRIMGDINV